MGKYLDTEAPRKAINLYLDELTHVERQQLQPETMARLTAKVLAPQPPPVPMTPIKRPPAGGRPLAPIRSKVALSSLCNSSTST